MSVRAGRSGPPSFFSRKEMLGSAVYGADSRKLLDSVMISVSMRFAVWGSFIDKQPEGHMAQTETAGIEDVTSTIEARVKRVVAEELGVGGDTVKNESSFVDDLGADSLDVVELVMALEAEFNIEIPDEEAEQITTVQQAIDWLTEHTMD